MFEKLRNAFNKVKSLYFFCSIIVIKIQLLALPLMIFCLKQMNQPSHYEAMNNMFNIDISPNEASAIHCTKTFLDISRCMTFCLMVSAILVFKAITSKHVTKWTKFNVQAPTLSVIKFSIWWALIGTFMNGIFEVVVTSITLYYPLTLVSQIVILFIMVKDQSFGIKIKLAR
ncbi:MAG: hypothetical protein KF820_04990 [Candidatus Paracaedibacteraceae bacterium]|nr:hypothetical protein [Candidatus Paracaedibacteraceae bacterium]